MDGITPQLIRHNVKYALMIETRESLPGFPPLEFARLKLWGGNGFFHIDAIAPGGIHTPNPTPGRLELTRVTSYADETPTAPTVHIPTSWGREHWIDLVLAVDGEPAVRVRLEAEQHRCGRFWFDAARARAHHLGQQAAGAEAPAIAMSAAEITAWLEQAGYLLDGQAEAVHATYLRGRERQALR